MNQQIKYVLESIHSEPDQYGNTYHAAVITRTEDGKRITLQGTGGDSNASYMLKQAIEEANPTIHYTDTWRMFIEINTLLPKREFKRRTGGWKYWHQVGNLLAEFDKE